METITNTATITCEDELECIKQEYTGCTLELLRLVKAFSVKDVVHPDAVMTLRKAQIAYHEAYVKLVYFIEKEYKNGKDVKGSTDGM